MMESPTQRGISGKVVGRFVFVMLSVATLLIGGATLVGLVLFRS